MRFIGEPGQRIAEDYLRILRFFRMHAAYGTGEPDLEGYDACIAVGGTARLSAERMRMEMFKMVVAGGRWSPHRDGDGGLLQAIFGGVTYTGHGWMIRRNACWS